MNVEMRCTHAFYKCHVPYLNFDFRRYNYDVYWSIIIIHKLQITYFCNSFRSRFERKSFKNIIKMNCRTNTKSHIRNWIYLNRWLWLHRALWLVSPIEAFNWKLPWNIFPIAHDHHIYSVNIPLNIMYMYAVFNHYFFYK